MVIQFLRENKAVSFVLAVIRVYLGYTWLMAGIGKLQGKGFDATGYLQGAIEKSKGAQPAVQSWWASFLQDFAIPNVDLFNTLVTWGEVLVGIGLIVGCLTKTAVFFGLVMNFSYMFSGSIGVNPEMVILSMFVLVSGMNAGKFGIDGFVIPKVLGSKLKTPKASRLIYENGYLKMRYPFMLFFSLYRIVFKEFFYITYKFLWLLTKRCMITLFDNMESTIF